MATQSRKKGFTLIELLVVIAIIALLLSIVVPALGRAKTYAQRIVCGNGLRQQALGTVLYSSENGTYVPSPLACTVSRDGTGKITSVTPRGAWFWDVSFWFTTELSRYAGFEGNKPFTCAGNKMRKPDDARWWQYSELEASGGTYPSEVTIKDETNYTADQLRERYRVLPYVYFFDKYVKGYDQGLSAYDAGSAIGGIPKTTVSGMSMTKVVIRRLADVKAAASRPMIMDAIISNNNDYEFTGMTVGGLWAMSGNTLTDDTNHMSKQRVTVGTNEGMKPAGGNIAFADGHVDWVNAGNYENTGLYTGMRNNYRYGMWFWW